MKILVIEDNPQHLEDAKRFFETQDVDVVYASTLSEARQYGVGAQETVRVDAIITDVHFPLTSPNRGVDRMVNLLDDGGQQSPQPLGVYVALWAISRKIPVVLITDKHHHGGVQWIDYIFRTGGLDFVPRVAIVDVETSLSESVKELEGQGEKPDIEELAKEAPKRKAWKRAYQRLISSMS